MFLKIKYKIVEIIVPHTYIFVKSNFSFRRTIKTKCFNLLYFPNKIIRIVVYIILISYLCIVKIANFMNQLKQFYMDEIANILFYFHNYYKGTNLTSKILVPKH